MTAAQRQGLPELPEVPQADAVLKIPDIAFRLLDANALKRALGRSSGTLAVIASPWFFDEVIRHTPASKPASYRRVWISVKETTTKAWICLPNDPYPPDEQALDHNVLTTDVQAVISWSSNGLELRQFDCSAFSSRTAAGDPPCGSSGRQYTQGLDDDAGTTECGGKGLRQLRKALHVYTYTTPHWALYADSRHLALRTCSQPPK
jgi:hypothetical protein